MSVCILGMARAKYQHRGGKCKQNIIMDQVKQRHSLSVKFAPKRVSHYFQTMPEVVETRNVIFSASWKNYMQHTQMISTTTNKSIQIIFNWR